MRFAHIVRRAAGVVLALALCCGPAAAFDGAGFTLDVPAGWVQEDGPLTAAPGDVYSWSAPEGSASFTVCLLDNADGINLFDLAEEDVDESLFYDPDRIAEGYEAQGYPCDILLREHSVTRQDWNGMPVLVGEIVYDAVLQESGAVVTLYQYMAMEGSREHIFLLGYAATNEADIAFAKSSGVMESFRITEAVFDGPSGFWMLWGDVVLDILGTLVCAAVAASGLYALLGKKKKSGQTPEPEDRLPPR